ncbi:MAG TPA: T9SS type A sorting domain-containing protein [Ignavibacteria bacterium]
MDTALAKYFPIAVGNKYVYLVQTIPIPTTSSRMKTTITKDTLIAGKKYFYFSNPPFFSSCWMRYDTLTGCVLSYSLTGVCPPYTSDKIVDSLASKINDLCTGCFFSFYNYRRCEDTLNITLFGNYQTKRKSFYHDGMAVGNSIYARNFGLYYFSGAEFDGTSYTLIGCVLNGVVYGDTTLTEIKSLNSEIPDRFSLLQNYPNPFNPRTVVRFQLSVVSNVVLKVYDVMGREVQTLVNEKLSAGTYEVKFDGSMLTSGVYFYKMQTGDFSETKKMILMK